MLDFIATTESPTLYEAQDPLRFYLACDDSNPPDWETAAKHLRPTEGVVIVEMLPAPKRVGVIWLPDVSRETRVEDETVAGFESSVGVVLAVGEGVPLSAGQRVLVLDGDGCEFEDFRAGAYIAKGMVRMFGRVAPEEDDTFTAPYQGYIENLPWEESIVAIIEGNDVQPTGTNILIQKDPFEHKSRSGIFIPDVGQERASTATIIECGPDCRETANGNRIVYHPEGEAAFFDSENPDLRIIREIAVLTVVEEPVNA